LLALCATENTRSRPVLLFTKQFLEEVFSETELPVYGILGNSISTTTHFRKPHM
jgi:hypothetical protein